MASGARNGLAGGKVCFHGKHGSWLNMAEMALAILSHMYLSQRIPDEATLRRQVETSIRACNAKARPGQVAVHRTGCPARARSPLSSCFNMTDY